jgi:hypothetical protein
MPLVYASSDISQCPLQDSRSGWIRYFLSCRALASPTTCRFSPALSGLSVIRSGPSVSRQASCSKIKRTSVNVDVESGIVANAWKWALGRPTSGNANSPDIVFGAVILFIGLTACSIAAVRLRSGVRLIIWLGIWSAMYGTGPSLMSPRKRTALTRRWPSMIAYWGAYDVTQRQCSP